MPLWRPAPSLALVQVTTGLNAPAEAATTDKLLILSLADTPKARLNSDALIMDGFKTMQPH